MKYTAFISYNSKDDKWAKWLQRKLEAYSIPVSIHREQESLSTRKGKLRIFRYRSDLNTISLRKGLAHELDEAYWLIVICSPNSAKSEWVGKEIQHFIDTGRKDRILPFIISGTSYSNDEDECLNPVLKAAFPDGDILGVNIDDYGDDPRVYRKRKALVRTVSILLEVPDAYSYLWNRYHMRFWEGVMLKCIGVVAIAGILTYALNYHAPFDVQVQLQELSARNELLPKPDSLFLTLKLDNEDKILVLNTIDSNAIYKNLPGDYAGKNARLTFEAFGYVSLDSMVQLKRKGSIVVGIQRDDTYGLLSGIVIDEQGRFIEGATIEAEGQTTTSDATGHFELHIPLESQRPQPCVTISRTGYRTEVLTEQTIGRNWQVMLLE